ncbi:adhesion G-protein coupled receptor F3-like isoform X2 [Dendrobates tinctorius]
MRKLIMGSGQEEEKNDCRDDVIYKVGSDPWENIQQKFGGRGRRSVVYPAPSVYFGLCTFPFTFNGVVYNQCTSDGGMHFYWCGRSANVDMDVLWGFCAGPGIVGLTECSPVYSSNKSYSLCLINPNDAIGTLLASIYCTPSWTYYSGYTQVYCNAPTSGTSTSVTTTPTVSSTTPNTSTSGRASSSTTNGSSTTTSLTTTPSSTTLTTTPSSTTLTTTPTSTTLTTTPSSTTLTTTPSSTTPTSTTLTTTPLTTTPSTTTLTTTPSSTTLTTTPSSTTLTTSSTSITLTTTPTSTTLTTTPSSTTLTTTPSSTNSSSVAISTLGGTTLGGTTPGETLSSSVFTLDTSTTSDRSDPPSTTGTSVQALMEQISQGLLSSAGGGVLQSLASFITISSAGFQQKDLPLVLYVLGNITRYAQLQSLRIDEDTVKKVLVITNQLLNLISSEPSLSLEKNLGPQLLTCLENLLSSMATTEHSFTLFFRYFDLHCSVTSCEVLEDNGILSLDSGTTVSLPGDDTDYSPRCLVNMFSVTYRPKTGSFNSRYDCSGDQICSYSLASAIQMHILKLNDTTHHVADVNMTFTCGNRMCDQTAVCVFWDIQLNKWLSNGCRTQVKYGVTSCLCHHLTSFSILMSGSLPESIANSSALDYMTKIGLPVSIVSLLICISIQVLLLRRTSNGMAFHRHVAILHMSAFLLGSHVSFLASCFIEPEVQQTFCVALTFCTHLFLLGFFGWTLVQGTSLILRLVFVFHHVTMTEFVVLSVVLGYLCPLAVSLGTFLAYYHHHYRRTKACWLDNDSGASMSFTIPTIIVISLNVLVLIVVIRKLLRPSISEGKTEDEAVVKKVAKAVLFCTPQFGLTWAVGIPILTNHNAEWLHYLFDLLNPLQGVFLLLFGCLLDNKDMRLVKKYLLKKSSSSTTSNSSAASVVTG